MVLALIMWIILTAEQRNILIAGSNSMYKDEIKNILDYINLDIRDKNPDLSKRKQVISAAKGCITSDTIVIAQTNPSPSDISNNAKKAVQYIEWANDIGAAAVIFPEMALLGYPIGDILERYPFIANQCYEQVKLIASKSKKTKILIGFPEINNDKTGKKYYNSIAVLANGSIEKIIRKKLLPTYNEFNDYRHFEPSNEPGDSNIIEIAGKKTAVVVC